MTEFDIIEDFAIEDFQRIVNKLNELKKNNPDKARNYIDWLIERINSFQNYLNNHQNPDIPDAEKGIFYRILAPDTSHRKHHFKDYSIGAHGGFLSGMIAHSIIFDDEQSILQPLVDYLSDEKKFIRTNKKIFAKHYALFHWCRIYLKEKDNIVRDINDKFPQQEILKIAENESYDCNNQSFYKNLIGIYSSNLKVLSFEFKRSDWLIVYHLSGFNNEYHRLLNKVQKIRNSK